MKPILLSLTLILSSLLFNISDSSATENKIANQSTESASIFANSCQCVAFRLDDIQDYFLTNAQVEVISTFEEKNANLTVGIIGNSFGNDLSLALFLKEKVARFSDGNSSFFLEVANHGWNHEEFTRLNKEDQSELIQQTNEKILNTLGIRPAVFIPPYNALNNDTIAALLENDIHYVSANATSFPPSALTGHQNESGEDTIKQAIPKTNTILHFPSAAATGDLNADNTEWLGYSHVATFIAINASLNELGYAVVTMHPMEFSLRNGMIYQNGIDYKQIRELELLIDDIRAAGFKVVTISEIDQNSGAVVPEFSSYSIHVILAVSIVVVIWLSKKSTRGNWNYSSRHSNAASL